MSRCKKTRWDNGFVQVTREQIDSVAYKRLSNAARVVLILIMSDYHPNKKPRYYDKARQTINDLVFTSRQASEYMRQETFSKTVLELISYGFITVWQHGTPLRKLNFYRLSDMWRLYGREGFMPQKVITSVSSNKRVYLSTTKNSSVDTTKNSSVDLKKDVEIAFDTTKNSSVDKMDSNTVSASD